MLKLDLLPAHYTIARRNRKVIFLSIPLLVGVVLAWLLVMVQMNSTITRTQQELEETTAQADQVRKIQADTEKQKGELKPIKDKVDFVLAADKSGSQYWERFYEINKFIYGRAVVTRFSITPPDAVAFDVEVETTEDAGRFILNLIQSPDITGISISGQPVAGGTIGGAAGAAPAAAPGGEMPPGAPPGGPEAGPPPGAEGMPGAPPGGAAPAAAAGEGPIRFSVTARLVKPIVIPSPPGGGDAAAGGPGGGPPDGGPGAPPGGPPPGEGGPPPGPPGGGGGGEDGGGGGGGGGDE